jgi:uncharacterized membrane protein
MDIVLNVLIGASLLAVLVSFILGLAAMARGPAAGARSNRLMQARVWTQAIAIGILVISLMLKARH